MADDSAIPQQVKDFEYFLLNQAVENGEAASHTSYTARFSQDRGAYFIPLEKNDQFLELYLDAIRCGYTPCISERILPRCRFHFFLDFDLDVEVFEELLTVNEYEEPFDFHVDMAETMTTALSTITENNIQLIYSTKPSQDHKIHINVPSIICDGKDFAVHALRRCQEHFMEKFRVCVSRTLAVVNWSKVFDPAPYNGGLRMLGSGTTSTDTSSKTYQVLDLERRVRCELDLTALQDTRIRLETSTGIQTTAYVQYGNSEAGIPINEIRQYVRDLHEGEFFGNQHVQPLSVSKIVSGFYPSSYMVHLNDRYCPFEKRPHQRKSRYMYLLIDTKGCRIKCYDDVCSKKNLLLAPLNQPLIDHFGDCTLISLKVLDAERNHFTMMNLKMDLLTLEARSLMGEFDTTPSGIGEVFFTVFKNHFKVTNVTEGKGRQWYFFKDHIYHKAPTMAMIAVMHILPVLYKLYIHELYASEYAAEPIPPRATETVTTDEEADLAAIKKYRLAMVKRIISYLKTTPGKVLDHAQYTFDHYYPKTSQLFNTKTHLIAFNNGVMDFEIPGEPIFRQGTPGDYITLSTGCEYESLSFEHPMVIEVMEFFSELFHNEKKRNYVLTILSKCLTKPKLERMYLFTGSGGNGKSKIVRLITKSFGQLWYDVPVGIFTQKRGTSSSAQPDVMAMKGVRLMTTQEPESNEKINSGVMKLYTGGDAISARQLFCEQELFFPQMTIIMICNDVPAPESLDNGTWRRMRCITFESKFVENPNPERQFEKKADPDLDQKMDKWPAAFMWILCEYRKRFPKDEIEECESVMLYTNEIRKEIDIFAKFIEACTRPLNDEEVQMNVVTDFATMMSSFNDYCTSNKYKKLKPHMFERYLKEEVGEFTPRSKTYALVINENATQALQPIVHDHSI